MHCDCITAVDIRTSKEFDKTISYIATSRHDDDEDLIVTSYTDVW
jgi:hypothetical protein